MVDSVNTSGYLIARPQKSDPLFCRGLCFTAVSHTASLFREYGARETGHANSDHVHEVEDRPEFMEVVLEWCAWKIKINKSKSINETGG